MKENLQTEEELDLGMLLCALMEKSWIILLAAILGAAIALVGSFYLVTPQYQSTATLYVDNDLCAEDLDDSFSVIVKMRDTLLDVVRLTQTDRSHTELRDMVEVSAISNTDFFRHTVTGPDPYEAERFANAIAQLLPEKVVEIMGEISVTVVDVAVIAAEPSSPNYANNGLLGAVIGMTLSMAVLFLQELFPPKKKSPPRYGSTVEKRDKQKAGTKQSS